MSVESTETPHASSPTLHFEWLIGEYCGPHVPLCELINDVKTVLYNATRLSAMENDATACLHGKLTLTSS